MDDLEEPAAPEPQGIPPLQDGPLPVLEEVFHNGRHVGGGELRREHLPDGRPSHNGLVGHLVVDGLLMVQLREGLRVMAVEGVYPQGDHLSRSQHRLLLSD